METEIAEIIKRYARREWLFDISTLTRRMTLRGYTLAGRILDRPGATMPVNGLQIRRGRK
jgi:hypothetical protein